MAVSLTSWRMKSLSSIASETECSVRLNGSQSDRPRGRGGTGGGVFKWRGSIVGAHDVWTPMRMRHVPEIVSPWVGNEVSVDVRHHPADFSALAKDLTHLPS